MELGFRKSSSRQVVNSADRQRIGFLYVGTAPAREAIPYVLPILPSPLWSAFFALSPSLVPSFKI
jgi:hypothetical protein